MLPILSLLEPGGTWGQASEGSGRLGSWSISVTIRNEQQDLMTWATFCPSLGHDLTDFPHPRRVYPDHGGHHSGPSGYHHLDFIMLKFLQRQGPHSSTGNLRSLTEHLIRIHLHCEPNSIPRAPSRSPGFAFPLLNQQSPFLPCVWMLNFTPRRPWLGGHLSGHQPRSAPLIFLFSSRA